MHASPPPSTYRWHSRFSALLVALFSFVGCVLPHADPMIIDTPNVAMDADAVVVDVDVPRMDVPDVPNPCGPNLTRCGADCVDLNSSANHCGRCGGACIANAHQTASCQLGMCANICMPPFLDCNAMNLDGCEVDTSNDSNNCGNCGTRCGANSTCTAGRCGCAMGFTMCGAACLNLQTDVNNCGGCGMVCPSRPNSTASCMAGRCMYTCQATHGDCNNDLNGMMPGNGCETVLGTNNDCRMCGERCMGGTPNCVRAMGCVNGCAPLSTCGGACVDVAVNPLHCGSCGRVCNGNNGTPTCVGGMCGVTCNIGFANCDNNAANGCEVNLNTADNNCGMCGRNCGANASCSNGSCQCAPNRGNCDNNQANGCEVDLSNTLAHCGGCGQACGPYANATPTCAMGACGLQCMPGFANCDGMLANGCEVNLQTNPMRCGSCNNVCNSSNGMAGCMNGTCTIACNAGFGNCDGMLSNGCEVTLSSNALHCGACGMACASGANATPVCNMSTCSVSCANGFANCDNNNANGCEVNLTNSAMNCGMCGTVCAGGANATGTCAGSTCGLTCSAGFGNCNNMAADGCETPLNTNMRCGTCGTSCMPLVQFCGAGNTCTGCPSGRRDCNGTTADMCEVDIATELANCGGCGLVCGAQNAAPVCAGAVCTLNCMPNFGNCDNNNANGCETDLRVQGNCGACGRTCMAPNPSCNDGVCGM